jgi:hypothetical protein
MKRWKTSGRWRVVPYNRPCSVPPFHISTTRLIKQIEMAVTVTPAAVLVLLLLSFSGPLHASPPEPVPLTLVDCATEKGAGTRCSSHVGFFLQSILLEIICKYDAISFQCA